MSVPPSAHTLCRPLIKGEVRSTRVIGGVLYGARSIEPVPACYRNAGITSLANSSIERVPLAGSTPGICIPMTK
jgi:hypothetical protein